MTKKVSSLVRAKAGESLLFFPKASNRGYSLFFGVGRIYSISKGENFDIVHVIFGVETMRDRTILVADNHGRRQVQTLKKGQFALFYGVCVNRVMDREIMSKYTNKPIKPKVTIFYAYMVQGMYVPRTIDIQKLNEDIANGIEEKQIKDMSEHDKDMFQKEIDKLLDYQDLKVIEDEWENE